MGTFIYTALVLHAVFQVKIKSGSHFSLIICILVTTRTGLYALMLSKHISLLVLYSAAALF